MAMWKGLKSRARTLERRDAKLHPAKLIEVVRIILGGSAPTEAEKTEIDAARAAGKRIVRRSVIEHEAEPVPHVRRARPKPEPEPEQTEAEATPSRSILGRMFRREPEPETFGVERMSWRQLHERSWQAIPNAERLSIEHEMNRRVAASRTPPKIGAEESRRMYKEGRSAFFDFDSGKWRW